MRHATCDRSVNRLAGWYTQQSQYCPYGPERPCPQGALWGGSRQGVLPATQDNWYANAVGDPSIPWHCVNFARGYPAGGRGIREYHSMPGYLLQGHSCPKEQGICPQAEGFVAGQCNLNRWVPRFNTHLGTRPWSQCWSGLIWSRPSGTIAAAAAICPRSLWKSFRGTAVLPDKVLRQFSTDWARSWVRPAVWLTESNSMPRKEILCVGTSLLFSQLTRRPNWLRCLSTRSLCAHNCSRDCASMSQSSRVVEDAHTPFSWWRSEATGTALRSGPCTDMLDPRTRIAGMACVVGGSRHESTRPSGRSLQTSWTAACEGHGSKLADPRSVVTHRFSWAQAQWSKGCKTLT